MAKGKGGFIGQDGLNAPDPATEVTATAGDEQVTVSWTAPSDVGGADITGYSVQSSNGDGTYLSSYDIVNASYTGNSLTVSSSESRPICVAISSDGTKLYVSGQTGDAIDQYTLSTAYDVSSGSYDSVTFSYSGSAGTNVQGMFFKPDGTKFFLTDDQNNAVYAYSMSPAWDLSNASYDSVNFSVSSQSTNTNGVVFNSDGSKFFIVGNVGGTATVYQYNMSTNWLVSSASYSNKSLNVSPQTSTGASGIQINSDDDSLFLTSSTTETIYEYQMSTENDLATASFANSYSTATETSALFSIYFGDSGTKLYACSYSDDTIYQYTTGLVGYPTSSPVTVTGLTNGTSYTFNVWAINPFGWSSPSGASGSVAPSAPLGVMVGGGQTQNIQYINIASTGNASDWAGDTNTGTRQLTAGLSSATRGVYIGGNDTGVTSIEYITFASQGNAATFGTCGNNYGSAGMSNGTRGVWAANAYDPDDIEYVTIATTGNTATFGNIGRNNGCYYPSACNSTTRGVFKFGMNTSFTAVKYMDYITIATTGNSSTFGNTDQFATRSANGVACSETRGLFMGGNNSSNTGFLNFIEYLTIATTGDNTDFGDLTVSRGDQSAAVTSKTRAVCCGGYTGTRSNVMDYVEIASTGNATDFGDLTTGEQQWTGMSSSHGGLS